MKGNSSNYVFALLINLLTIFTANAQTDWHVNSLQNLTNEKNEIGVVVVPTLSAGTLTNPTFCGADDGTIAFTTTNVPDDYYTLNFKKNNVAQSPVSIWISSNAFILDNTIFPMTAGSYSDFSIVVDTETATLAAAQVLSNPTLTLAASTLTHPTVCGLGDGSITFTTTNIFDDYYIFSFKKNNVAQTPITIYISSNSFVLDNSYFSMTAGSYSDFSIAVGSCTVSLAAAQVLTNPIPTLAAGTLTNPTSCLSNGSIAFTTTNIPSNNYTLSYKKNGANQSTTVNVGINTFTLSNLPADSYSDFSITINNCPATFSAAQVLSNPTITLATGTLTQPTSCTGSNGSIAFVTTNAPNGTYSLTFKKDGVAQTPRNVNVSNNTFTLSSLNVGSYADFSITFGTCSASLATAQVLTGLTPTLTAGTKTNPTSCGGSNGSIAFTTTNIANGSYFFNFKKDGVAQTQRTITVSNNTFTLNTLGAGSYADFLITVGSCTGSLATAQVLSNPSYTLTAGTITKPTTCGGTNGSIAFTTTNITTNGAYNLQYKKDGVAASLNVNISGNAFTLSNLSAASYADFSLTVNSCTVTLAAAQVVSNPTTTLSAGTLTHPTTCTSTNGSIAFTTTFTSNGAYVLNYKKNSVSQTTNISLASNAFTLGSQTGGSYSDFSLTANGCTATTSLTQTLNPPTATISASIIINPTSCGGTNGFIQFSTTNIPSGSYSLSYKKNNVAQTATISASAGIFQLQNLTAGTYSDFSLTVGVCNPTFNTAQVLSDPSSNLSVGVLSQPTCVFALGSIGFTSSNVPDGNYTLSYKRNNVTQTATLAITNNQSSALETNAGFYNDFSLAVGACTANSSQKITIGDFNIWTGATNQDWSNTSNWSMSTVPASGTDVKIPSWATNQPTISTTENSGGIIVESGATLTISSSGSLTVHFPVSCLAAAFFNSGTVQNNGTLTLGSSNGLGAYALSNYGNFNNNTGSTLIINRSTDTGLHNIESGVFTNSGLIKIGNITTVGTRYSIWNAGVFTNSNTIEIDRATTSAIHNASATAVKATFNNTGTLLIGKYNTNSGHGINNIDNFNNNSGGNISISRVSNICILNQTNGSFINAGSLNLGVEVGTMNVGIENNATFDNNSSGTISIQKTYDGLKNAVNFTNNGTIEINTVGETYEGFKNTGTFTNNACAKLIVLLGRGRNSSGTINNLGLIQIAHNFYNHSTFNNNGILAYGFLDTSISPVAITNNDVIVGTISANGSVITPALQIGGANSFTIANTWYSDAAQITPSGTYTTATNSFTSTQAVPGTYTNYLSVNDNTNSCARVVPINITLTAAIISTLSAGTLTNPTTCGGTNGSIAFTTTNVADASYILNFKKDGVAQSPRTISVNNNAFILNVLLAGSYSEFSMVVGGNTASLATAQVLNNPTYTLTAGTITAPSTCGGTNGNIAFTTTNVSNGNYTLSYKKDNVLLSPVSVFISNNAFTLNNLSAGSYSDFSLSVNNCTATFTTTQVVTNPTPILTAGTLTNPTTCTANDGSIAFTTTFIANGTYTLNYKKDGIAQSSSISLASNAFVLGSLTAGTYTDFSLVANGCTASFSTSQILNTPTTSLSVLTINSPSNCGGNNGLIQFSTTNIPEGTYTLSYKKNNVAQTLSVYTNGFFFNLDNLTAGSYSDFSMAVGACTVTLSTAQVVADPTPTLNVAIQTNTTCETPNGFISIGTENIVYGTYTLSYKKNSVTTTTSIAIGNTFSTMSADAGYYTDFSITYGSCTATASQKITMGSTNIWTGATSQNWNTATNWSKGTTPISVEDAKIPSWATNQPTISTTEAIKGIVVESGATLTISSSGGLTLISPVTCSNIAFLNNGTVQNNGMLNLAISNNNLNLEHYGLQNAGNFNIGSSGTLIINGTIQKGLFNHESGVFTNAGLIKIGITDLPNALFGRSLWNAGVFTNSNAIEIDNAPAAALFNQSSTAVKAIFNNNGTLDIGKNDSNYGYGIENFDDFNNNIGGIINISRTPNNRRAIQNNGNVVNAGSINLGGNFTLFYGILNTGNFNNNVTGSINMQNAYTGLANGLNFTNNGNIEINAVVQLDNGFINSGTLTNNTCAKLIVLRGQCQNSSTVNNFGLIQIANNLTNTSTFNNNGILAYGSFAGSAIANNDVIITPVSTCGGVVNPALQIGGANSFTIANTWFSDAAQTTASGTYTTATNSFTSTQAVPGTYTNYLSITDNANNCVRIVPINITLTAIPTLTAGTVTSPSNCTATDGSIAFTTTLNSGSYSLNYSKNGIVQTPATVNVSSGIFFWTGLSAGNYSNFSIVSNGCTSTDASTKVVSPSQPTQNVTDAITSGTVTIIASQTITATNQISNANVTYKAGQSVTLLPGFQATGNKFEAIIGSGCN
jgi:hypothetical protein